MGGANVNPIRTVAAVFGASAFRFRPFVILIGTVAIVVVVASLIGIAVILHQTTFAAIICGRVHLIAEIIEQRYLRCLQLIIADDSSSACHGDFDVAIGSSAQRRCGRQVHSNVMWYGLLDGRMRVHVCGPVAEVRRTLAHAGHARRHLGVRHAQRGRHTQYGAAAFVRVGVVAGRIQLMRIGGQIVCGKLQRMLILALCERERGETLGKCVLKMSL